jgi:AraC-like DNA-binding protein
VSDPLLRQRIHQLHRVLGQPGEEFEAENRLAFITERLRGHLSRPGQAGPRQLDGGVAHGLRGLIDARFREKVTLSDASSALHAHPAHLVRVFSREFGISPHQYMTGRRVDLARRLLLDGMPPSLAAAEAGFYDQSHLSRHFTRALGVPPGQYARARLSADLLIRCVRWLVLAGQVARDREHPGDAEEKDEHEAKDQRGRP